MTSTVPTATVTVGTAPAPTTLGSSIDAELAVVKARLVLLEADAKTDWSKVKAWFGTNWAHLVSWAGVGSLVVDKFGLLKLL